MYVLLFSMSVKTICHGRGLSVSLDDVMAGHVCLSVSRLVDNIGKLLLLIQNFFRYYSCYCCYCCWVSWILCFISLYIYG
jgi:hypothetical protein